MVVVGGIRLLWGGVGWGWWWRWGEGGRLSWGGGGGLWGVVGVSACVAGG